MAARQPSPSFADRDASRSHRSMMTERDDRTAGQRLAPDGEDQVPVTPLVVPCAFSEGYRASPGLWDCEKSRNDRVPERVEGALRWRFWNGSGWLLAPAAELGGPLSVGCWLPDRTVAGGSPLTVPRSGDSPTRRHG